MKELKILLMIIAMVLMTSCATEKAVTYDDSCGQAFVAASENVETGEIFEASTNETSIVDIEIIDGKATIYIAWGSIVLVLCATTGGIFLKIRRNGKKVAPKKKKSSTNKSK